MEGGNADERADNKVVAQKVTAPVNEKIQTLVRCPSCRSRLVPTEVPLCIFWFNSLLQLQLAVSVKFGMDLGIFLRGVRVASFPPGK